MFVTLGDNLKFHYWYNNDLQTYSLEKQPSTHKILDVSFSHDNSYIVCTRENEKPQTYSIKNKQNIHPLHLVNVPDVVHVVCVPTTKKFIVLSTKIGDLIVYNLRERTIQNTFNKITTNRIKSIKFNCNGKILCCLDDKHLITSKDIFDNKTIEKHQLTTPPTTLRCHPYQCYHIMIGFKIGHVVLWDLRDNCQLVLLEITNHPIDHIAISSCGNFLITASNYNLIITAVDYQLKKTSFQLMQEQDARVVALDLCPVENLLVVGYENGLLKIFDSKSYEKPVYIGQICGDLTKLLFCYHPDFGNYLKIKGLETTPPSASIANAAIAGSEIIVGNHGQICGKFRNFMKIIVNEIARIENLFADNLLNHQRFVANEFSTINQMLDEQLNIFGEN